MSTDDRPFFLTQNEDLLAADASAELLHPEKKQLVKGDSLSETQYFGFNIPEEEIYGYTYMWHHPNLRVVTGGLWVCRGVKRYMVQAELCDIRTFMNDSALQNDLHSYRLDNGYGVEILEPLKRFHVTYSDKLRNQRVDLIYEAVAPAVMFGDGNHLEQPLRAKGDLVLRGKHYKVDCYCVRDRSWGKLRPEEHIIMPPVSWMSGVFNDDFCFNATVADQASGNPELTGVFALPDEKTLASGWIYRGNKVGRLVRAKKRVVRERDSLLPRQIELELTDEFGRDTYVRGALLASCPYQTWANVVVPISLIRWECEGLVAHGDCMEPMWNDYCNLMAARDGE